MSKKSDKEKLAELFGLELPEGNIYESPAEISHQAEAVLAFAKDASYFVTRNCLTCGRIFAHTYGQVAYCSDICRAAALEKIGIKWEWVVNAGKRWDYLYAEPLVIPPDAYALIQGLGHVSTSPTPTAEPVVPPEHGNPPPGVGIDPDDTGRREVEGSPLTDVIDILRSLGLE